MSEIIHGLDHAEYLAADGVNKSTLDLIAKSPAHYHLRNFWPRQSTPAQQFGTWAHELILEGELKTAALEPDCDRRTKVGKEEYAQWQSENDGKTPISAEKMNALMAMEMSVYRHPLARELLEDIDPEVSVFTADEATGLPTKIRIDALRHSSTLIDLKSTADASENEWIRKVVQYRYHVQQAFYVDMARAAGIDVKSFVFVVVESVPPYLTAVYELDEDAVALGRWQYRRDLDLLAWCLKHDQWPGYPEVSQTLSLPHWYFTQCAYGLEEVVDVSGIS